MHQCVYINFSFFFLLPSLSFYSFSIATLTSTSFLHLPYHFSYFIISYFHSFVTCTFFSPLPLQIPLLLSHISQIVLSSFLPFLCTYFQLCVRFMWDSINVVTACEFLQVYIYSCNQLHTAPAYSIQFSAVIWLYSLHIRLVHTYIQAALTYQQTSLLEECLAYIEANTKVTESRNPQFDVLGGNLSRHLRRWCVKRS